MIKLTYNPSKLQRNKLGSTPDDPISASQVTLNVDEPPICETVYGRLAEKIHTNLPNYNLQFNNHIESDQDFHLWAKELKIAISKPLPELKRTTKEIAESLLHRESMLHPDSIKRRKLRQIELKIVRNETLEQTITRHKQKVKNQRIKTEAIQVRRYKFNNNRAQLLLAMLNSGVDYVCVINGCTDDNITIDHIIPISKRGSDELDNLQFLCRNHNTVKGVKIN